jgi:hypothetical protein
MGEMSTPEQITVRRAEPDDHKALHKIFSGCRAIESTLQLRLPSGEEWRRRLSEPSEATHELVACMRGGRRADPVDVPYGMTSKARRQDRHGRE